VIAAGGPGPGVDALTEARALAEVVRVLEGLDAAAVGRVLEWAVKRYTATADGTASSARDVAASPPGPRRDEHDLAELYEVASPSTDGESVLVAAYWHQIIGRDEHLDSQSLNTDLKNLGHGIGNVTRACSSLINQKPALMIQLRKGGATKQARKQYRLTAAGIQRVREMLTRGDGRES